MVGRLNLEGLEPFAKGQEYPEEAILYIFMWQKRQREKRFYCFFKGTGSLTLWMCTQLPCNRWGWWIQMPLGNVFSLFTFWIHFQHGDPFGIIFKELGVHWGQIWNNVCLFLYIALYLNAHVWLYIYIYILLGKEMIICEI